MIPRYSTPEIVEIWSERTKIDTWTEIEIEACRAWESVDPSRVPPGTADYIAPFLKGKIEPGRVLEIEEKTRHDFIAFLSAIEEKVGDFSRFVHLGMTSSDVVDTYYSISLVKSGYIIRDSLIRLSNTLASKSYEWAHTPCVGRTHGMHGEPTSLGLVFGSFVAEINRNVQRLDSSIESVRTGKISGAMGNYAHVPPEVETQVLRHFNLKRETIATQVVSRDRYAEFFSVLAIVGSSLERLATTIRHWSRPEVGEAEEGFRPGQKGSSAMPHKRNPIGSENICGIARLLRGYAASAMENIPLWHERDISHSSVERVIGPDATCLADFAIRRMNSIVEQLRVNPDRIKKNLELMLGTIYSEGVLLEISLSGVARQEAYEVVQKASFDSLSSGRPFLDLVRERTGLEVVESSPEHYCRYVPEMLARLGEERTW